MIANFLRRPRGAAEYVADALRVIGLLSVIAAAVFFQATDAGVLAFLLPGLLLPRFIGARPAFDIVFSVLLLVAGWSNLLDLYTSVRWWDIPVHIACTGAIAALVYLLLAQVGVLAHPARFAFGTSIPLTTAFGLAVSALWEMVEWFGHAFISSAIFVEYNDTIGDMAVGALGALAAGVLLSLVPLSRASLASSRASSQDEAQSVGGSQSSIGSPSGSWMRANRP